MATQLQLRRGTTSQIAAFTGANGEIAVDTDIKTIYVQDGATAGGFAMARADFSNISASASLTLGTLNATTLNVTTLDLTNLEVTTIKAKDGTAAGSIADSTGVVTIASAVLTTADINAGTFDGVVGGTTPAAGSFTTVSVDNITIDGTEIDLSSGDLTLDVAGEINLDADGGKIRFKDGGTEHLRFVLDNAGFVQLYSAVQDADIKIQGNDGGVVIDALTFDMGEGGSAAFAGGVTATRFDAATSSTTDPVLQLTDTGVADYDFTFPSDSVIKLSTNTTSTKQFLLENAGSGNFDFYSKGSVYVGQYLRLLTTDDAANEWVIYSHTDDSLRINYNGSGSDEIMVGSDGRMAVGAVPSTTYQFKVNGANQVAVFQGDANTNCHIAVGNTSHTQYANFMEATDTGNTQIWRNGSGYSSYGTGTTSTVMYNSAGDFTFNPSGSTTPKVVIGANGIAFNTASPTNDNSMNNYEQGSWTPVFNNTTASAAMTGGYIRIGDYVWFQFYSGAQTLSSSTSSAYITGLPYTPRGYYFPCVVSHYNCFNYANVDAYVQASAKQIWFIANDSITYAGWEDGYPQYLMVAGGYYTSDA